MLPVIGPSVVEGIIDPYRAFLRYAGEETPEDVRSEEYCRTLFLNKRWQSERWKPSTMVTGPSRPWNLLGVLNVGADAHRPWPYAQNPRAGDAVRESTGYA